MLNMLFADPLVADVPDAWARVKAGVEWVYVWAFVALVLSILWAVRGLRTDVREAAEVLWKGWHLVTTISQREAAEPADGETLPFDMMDKYYLWRDLAIDGRNVIVKLAHILMRFVIGLLRWMLFTSLLTMPCTLMLVLAPPWTSGPDGLGMASLPVIRNWVINVAMFAILVWLVQYFYRAERGPELEPLRLFARLAAPTDKTTSR